MASLQNGELPNPKVILWSLFLIQGNIVVSGNLIKLAILTVCTHPWNTEVVLVRVFFIFFTDIFNC